MADYMNQSVFQPSIPKHLITDEDRRFIEAFSITFETDGEDKFYLYADEWCCNGYIDPAEPGGEEIELTEDDLLNRFQEIIRRSNGELPWISKESAYTCSRMRPDGFGGGAVFITADDIQYCFTGQWLEQRISEAESGDIGPETDDSPTEINRELLEACIQARAALPDAWFAVQCDTPKEVIELLNRAITRAEQSITKP